MRWDWSTPSVKEVERLLGFDGNHTAVPACVRAKRSSKLPSRTRWRLLANTRSVPVFRVVALALIHSMGIPLGPIECHGAAIIHALLDDVSPDPFAVLWGLEGQDFVRGYVDCLPQPIREVTLPFLHLFDSPQSGMNPFTANRAGEEFLVSGLWRPDLREADRHASPERWPASPGPRSRRTA